MGNSRTANKELSKAKNIIVNSTYNIHHKKLNYQSLCIRWIPMNLTCYLGALFRIAQEAQEYRNATMSTQLEGRNYVSKHRLDLLKIKWFWNATQQTESSGKCNILQSACELLFKSNNSWFVNHRCLPATIRPRTPTAHSQLMIIGITLQEIWFQVWHYLHIHKNYSSFPLAVLERLSEPLISHVTAWKQLRLNWWLSKTHHKRL
jgi:hypothetical protein